MALPAWYYMVQWITLSCVMILLNKAILSTLDLPFPLFLTSWHMLLSATVTRVMSKISYTSSMLPAVADGRVTPKIFLERIIPIGVLFALSLAMGNQAYLYLSVSFIQMLKAFTPVAVLVAASALGLEDPSVLQLTIVGFISLGVSITAVGELRFNLMGFFFQIGGIVAEASRLVMQDKVLKELKLDSLSALYYITPVSFTTIATGFFFFESATFPWDRVLGSLAPILILNGVAAFALNIAIVLLISNTSALVLSLGGILKDILLVIFSIVFFGAPVSGLQVFGYAISLFSMNIYKDYKSNPQEMTQRVHDTWAWMVTMGRVRTASSLSGTNRDGKTGSSKDGKSSAVKGTSVISPGDRVRDHADDDESAAGLLGPGNGNIGHNATDRGNNDRGTEEFVSRLTRSPMEVRDQFRTSGVVKI